MSTFKNIMHTLHNLHYCGLLTTLTALIIGTKGLSPSPLLTTPDKAKGVSMYRSSSAENIQSQGTGKSNL